MRRLATLALAVAIPLLGQAQKDFLSADEIDQIREAQEPNARLELYVTFAKSRVEMVRQLTAKEKAGRSILIHDKLDEFSKIIEAIDTVADDAIRRKVDVTVGMKAVAAAEQGMLETLQKVEEAAPSDLERYQFVLKNAIDTTSDSVEMSQQDLKARAAGVNARDEQEKKERVELSTPEKVEEMKKEEKKTTDDAKKQRKAPTLRRKTETEKKE
ncbi:MAG: hypothetical protein ABI693_15060 [Bryobacteraceae bacterium]